MINVLTGMKLVKVADAVTAATSDVTSASVNMAGYESVVFFTSLGTAAANNLMHAEQSSDDGSSDGFSDLAGTATPLAGASDEDLLIELVQPTKQYVRVVVQRGTSSTLGDIWALLHGARRLPIDNIITGTSAGSIVQSPAEGTP